MKLFKNTSLEKYYSVSKIHTITKVSIWTDDGLMMENNYNLNIFY